MSTDPELRAIVDQPSGLTVTIGRQPDLREYLAGQAMAGLLAGQGMPIMSDSQYMRAIAGIAWQYADAMLASKARKPPAG